MMPPNVIAGNRKRHGRRLAAIATGSVNKESMKPWEFWIDVGGTFTDCIACSPEDDLVPLKVLSSAVTKGRVQQVVGTDRLVDSSRTADPADFWVGYPLRCLDRDGHPLLEASVTAFDMVTGRLTIDQVLPDSIRQGTTYELVSPEEAPILAIRHVLSLRLDEPIPEVSVRLGTTRGTNALLTREGARTVLVTTRGFADVPLIGNQDRPRLFDLVIRKPEPLFERVVEVDERIDADGNVLSPPQLQDVRQELEAAVADGIESTNLNCDVVPVELIFPITVTTMRLRVPPLATRTPVWTIRRQAIPTVGRSTASRRAITAQQNIAAGG